ncbi:MAG: carboxypeptidase regulatory-like domain-containing protein, partial [Acidobacteria bacterium]|nr:carboxypeptidase regulatory-like domain-containing protein [Acidobacteriota bacterium]
MKYFKNSFIFAALFLLSALAILGQDPGSVKGIVRAESGKKLSGVEIVARQDGKNLKSTRTDKSGEFRIDGLNPGKYNLVFEKDGFASGVLYDVLIIGKKVNNLKDRLIMSIDEGTLVIVKGSVFNQFGRSIYGAKVVIEEIRSDNSTKKIDEIYSSRSGQFTFKFDEGKK